MNPTLAIQQQMLQTLMQALDVTAAQTLKAGETVDATFLRWVTAPPGQVAGAAPETRPAQPGPGAAMTRATPDAPAAASPAGTPQAASAQNLLAEVRIGTARLLVALGPEQARAAFLHAGATLTLAVEKPARSGVPAEAKLVAIAPAQPATDAAGSGARADIRTPTQAATIEPPARPSLVQAARAAAGPELAAALARQDSFAPLFANLEALASACMAPAARAGIPGAVFEAAIRALGFRLPADTKLTGETLRWAVAQGGSFHEARLLQGQPEAAARDLKSALLSLRAALAEAGAAPRGSIITAQAGQPAEASEPSDGLKARPGAASTQPAPEAASEPPDPAPRMPEPATRVATSRQDHGFRQPEARAAAPLQAEAASAKPPAAGPVASQHPGVAALAADRQAGIQTAAQPGLQPANFPAQPAAQATEQAPSLPGPSLPLPDRPQHPNAADRSAREAAPAPYQVEARAPAPRRDGLPSPQAPAEASIDPVREAPASVLGKLAAQTEAALDRLSLNQYASLPSPIDASAGGPTQRWFVETPLLIDGRTAVLPLEIEEFEEHGGGGAAAARAKEWRVRFALDVEPLGLIHALVTMSRRAVQVAVWAEREDTSRLVRHFASDLQAALTAETFERAEIDVLTGRPRQKAAGAGQFLDRRT